MGQRLLFKFKNYIYVISFLKVDWLLTQMNFSLDKLQVIWPGENKQKILMKESKNTKHFQWL